MLTLEVVAKPGARGLHVAGLTAQHRLDRLGADRCGAAHPALALVRIELDQARAQSLDELEGPVRTQFDRVRPLAIRLGVGVNRVGPATEERRVADVVGAQQRLERDAVTHELARVLDGGRRRFGLAWWDVVPNHVGEEPEDALAARVGLLAEVAGLDGRELSVDRVGDVACDRRQPVGVHGVALDQMAKAVVRFHGESVMAAAMLRARRPRGGGLRARGRRAQWLPVPTGWRCSLAFSSSIFAWIFSLA